MKEGDVVYVRYKGNIKKGTVVVIKTIELNRFLFFKEKVNMVLVNIKNTKSNSADDIIVEVEESKLYIPKNNIGG